MNYDSNSRKYLIFDPKEGWPSGDGLFYECLKCGTQLLSTEDGDCRCHNLYIDASVGRIGADDLNKVRLFQIIERSEKDM